MSSILIYVLPSITVTGLSIHTICVLRNHLRHRNERKRQINIMLLTVCSTFVFLTTPYQIIWWYEQISSFKGKTKSLEELSAENDGINAAQIVIIKEITTIIKNSSYIINFFIYTISPMFFASTNVKFSATLVSTVKQNSGEYSYPIKDRS
ncbi:hypothetical protein ACOME3_001427 [Neoechinorhynchus agilis]